MASSRRVVRLRWGILWALTAAPLSGSAVTLAEVVQQALDNGPSVLAEVNERKSREEEVKQARSGYYPRVDLILGYGRENSDNPATRRATGDDVWLWRREASLEGRQMLFDGFATRSEVERQSARVNSSVYRTQGVAESVALRTVQVYLDVLRQERLLELAKANLETHATIQDLISKRTVGGKGRGADLDQVNGRVALARANVEAEKGNLDNARATYREVVGQSVPESGTMEKPGSPTISPGSEEQAIDTAIDNHPILKSATADIDATRAQHLAANSPFYPRLDLELSRGLNEDLDGVNGTDNDFLVMLRLRYNLLKGGGDVARRGQTAHLINEAKDVREITRRQVIEATQLSWRARKSTTARIQFLEQHRDSSEKARDAYQEQFRLGIRSLLDRLDAENELFEARRSVVNAEFDQLFSQYRIVGSIGRLRDEFEVDFDDEGTPLSLPGYITASDNDR